MWKADYKLSIKGTSFVDNLVDYVHNMWTNWGN